MFRETKRFIGKPSLAGAQHLILVYTCQQNSVAVQLVYFVSVAVGHMKLNVAHIIFVFLPVENNLT